MNNRHLAAASSFGRQFRQDPIFAARWALQHAKKTLVRTPDPLLGIIACFPKSGSTYFLKLLCEITGYPRAILVPLMGSNEQDMNERLLKQHLFKGGISQQHVKGTYHNARLMQKYALRVVVLTRNIYDVIISLCDHITNDGPPMPTGYIPAAFSSMSSSEKWMFLIRIHAPWYLNFLMSWEEAQQHIPTCWVDYEDLVQHPLAVLPTILTHWGIMRVTADQMQQAIKTMSGRETETRFNVGVVGRGEQLLSASHKEAMEELADSCALSATLRSRVGLSIQARCQ